MHGTCDTHRLAVHPLDDELVLEHDKVALALLVLHELLQTRAERVEEVARANGRLFLREETDPAEARDDALSLGRVGEAGLRLDRRDKGAASPDSSAKKLTE